jgi:hypothetical protein
MAREIFVRHVNQASDARIDGADHRRSGDRMYIDLHAHFLPFVHDGFEYRNVLGA